jgi:hypothetical protein
MVMFTPPSGMVEVLMKNGFLSLSYAESEKESHMPDRQDLKYQLFSSRKVNGTTFCPICRQPVSNSRPFDMHEAILTRGDVQGCRPEVQDAIMVRQNCVLVHHEKCHELAATDWGQLKCLQHLILFEGFGAIFTWLNQMDELLKGNQAQLAAQKLIDAFRGLDFLVGAMTYNRESVKPPKVAVPIDGTFII